MLQNYNFSIDLASGKAPYAIGCVIFLGMYHIIYNNIEGYCVIFVGA